MEHVAKIISAGMNPILAVILLIAFLTTRRGSANESPSTSTRLPWTYAIASAAGIALSVWLAELGKDVLLYPDPGGFPSGHETFAVSTGTCLVWIDRRWLYLVVPVAIIMAVALVLAHYHHPVDVAGAAAISPITTSAVLVLWRYLTHPRAHAA